METSKLTGAALDWAVAKCEVGAEFIGEIDDPHFYSTDWAQGGPIIEREKINLEFDPDVPQWFASYDRGEVIWGCSGLTPLVAAMRCYVACQLGNEIEIPEQLVEGE